MVGRFVLVGEPVVTATADVCKAYDTQGEFDEVALKLLRIPSTRLQGTYCCREPERSVLAQLG